MNSKIVEIVHPFREKKKKDDELKRKMKKTDAVSFCLFSIFFPSRLTTTFYLNSMRLKLEILFRQLTQFETEENNF